VVSLTLQETTASAESITSVNGFLYIGSSVFAHLIASMNFAGLSPLAVELIDLY